MISSLNLAQSGILRHNIHSAYENVSLTRPAMPAKRPVRRIRNSTVTKMSIMPTNDFSGTAEKLNGRLAMLGFLSGSGYELLSGVNYLDQLKETWPFALSLIGVVTFATLKTRNLEVEEELPFTTDLELLNGRMAMLGLLCKFIYDSNVLNLQ